MKTLTKEKITIIVKRPYMSMPKNLCDKYGSTFGIDSNVLLGIYAIETFYRPFYFRLVEYFLVVVGGFNCLLLKRPLKNFTIGKCQLGLATILNYYGYDYYQHSKYISIKSFVEIGKLMSIISTDKCIEILAYKLKTIVNRGDRIYPNRNRNYFRYIGEQFNGRYSYGMLFSEVYYQLKTV